MDITTLFLLLAALVGVSFHEVTDCIRVDRPGSVCNVSKNDSAVQKAAWSGIYTFNNQTNDAYLFKTLKIDDAKKQIVKGVKFILEVRILRTVCRKTDHADLRNCHFQSKGKLHQIFHCHFEVWAMQWLKVMKTTFFICRP